MVNKEDLARIPLFSQLSDAEREKVVSITKKMEFLRDNYIFNQDGSGGQLFIVHKGEVKITRLIREHHEQTLAVLRNGDFLGAVSLIDGKEHSASAVCTADSVIFTIYKADFDKLAQEDTALGLKILKLLTTEVGSFLRTMNSKFIDMVQYVSITR